MDAFTWMYFIMRPLDTSTAAMAVLVVLSLEGSFATYLSKLVHKNGQSQQEKIPLNE